MLLPEDLAPPPFTDDDLDAYFQCPEGLEEGDPLRLGPDRVDRWEITDTGSADWAMRKYAHTEARIEEAKLAAAEFHRQIDAWLARETSPLERRANYFAGLLTEFLRKRREDPADGRASIPLPSGDIVSRKVPARPEIIEEDKERFINWARAMELPVIKATWKPVMAEVKKRVEFKEVDGQVVGLIDGRPAPGVVQVPEHVNYAIKPAKP